MLKFIDEIFEALYGSKYASDGIAWSTHYSYEIKEMDDDYHSYIDIITLVDVLTIDISDVVKFLVYLEGKHIGNDHIVKDYLSIAKLGKVALKLIKEINEKYWMKGGF